MLHILHVLEPRNGGVPRYVRDVTRALISLGHEVGAVVSNDSGIADELHSMGAQVERITFVPEISLKNDLRSLRELLPKLRTRRWDVVHTHGNKAGTLARPLARMLGLRVVHSPHGFAYLTQRARPRTGVEARRLLTLWIERVLAPCTHTILNVSEAERQTAIRDRIARSDRLFVVRNGVPSACPHDPVPTLENLRVKGPLVGFLGRLVAEKGPLLLIDALTVLQSKGLSFSGAIVGDGPLEKTLQERVVSAGLDDRVHVCRFSEIGHAALGAFDIFVLPSDFESLPIAILEAMAAGIPIIATDVGGVREAVIDYQTGFLVPRRDSAALADAIEALLRDSELRSKLGDGARAHQQQHFSFDRMMDELIGVYQRAARPPAVRDPVRPRRAFRFRR